MNKVLIVNHDEIMQMLYADELSEEGYDVRIRRLYAR